MKKIKIIALILSLCLSVAALFTGCDRKKESVPTDLTEIKTLGDVDNIHIFNVSETNAKIVENGTCSYKIIIPENCTSIINRAAAEFANFFLKSTGINIGTQIDTQVTYSSDSKFFVFGDTNFISNASISSEKRAKLNSSSYAIKTSGKSIFVVGGGDYGVLHGAYELLHQLFNFEVYAFDTIVSDKNVKNLNFKSMDIVDVADIEYCHASYGQIYTNSKNAHRMRSYVDAEMWMPEMGCHDIFRLLNPEVYLDAHPLWYNSGVNQLCYTAHGNPEEYEQLVSTLVAEVKKKIDENPLVNNLSITQMDVSDWCSCETCTASKAKYGTDAATQIKTVNDVAERVENWLNAERNGRKVNIVIFAYHRTETAPVKEVNGEYVPIDNSVILRDNVCLWYAPVYASYNYSIYDVENISTYTGLMQWSKLTKSLYLWYYDVNFNYYLLPYDTIGSKQDWYKCSYLNGAKYCFDQGSWNMPNAPAFSNLKIYLNNKLCWNVNSDVNELTESFFENFFGPAKDIVFEYYNELETVIYENRAESTGIYSPIRSNKIWNKSTVHKWVKMLDDAAGELESIRLSDPEKYKLYLSHVKLESITPRYLVCELFSTSLGTEEMAAFKASLKKDMDALGVTRLGENSSTLNY